MSLQDIIFAIMFDLKVTVDQYQDTGDKETLDEIISKITDLRETSFFVLDKTNEILDTLEAGLKSDRETLKRLFTIVK